MLNHRGDKNIALMKLEKGCYILREKDKKSLNNLYIDFKNGKKESVKKILAVYISILTLFIHTEKELKFLQAVIILATTKFSHNRGIAYYDYVSWWLNTCCYFEYEFSIDNNIEDEPL